MQHTRHLTGTVRDVVLLRMPKSPRNPKRSSLKAAAKKMPNKPNESARKVTRKRAPTRLVKGVVDADVIDALLPNETQEKKRKFGGPQERTGRKPNKLREYLAFEAELQVPRLRKGIEKIKHAAKRQLARQRYVDLCLKYGVGTTVTQTRTDGSDINPPGTLSPNEMVLGIMKLLGKDPNEDGA